MPRLFELQGHRGARGLHPENTLASFEAALDACVSAIEADVHRTRDGMLVLAHDPDVSPRVFRLGIDGPALPPSRSLAIAALTLQELRAYRADCNPDPVRFPDQDPSITPLARLVAQREGHPPYAPPTLPELFAFTDHYAGDLGRAAGKTEAQQLRARTVRFDLELKRVPFCAEGGVMDCADAELGRLESSLVEAIQLAGMVQRTTVRSFDHRSVLVVGRLEPRLVTAVLVAGTAPVAPEELAQRAAAQLYCPDFEFLDVLQVRQLHAAGIRVVPWTVNDHVSWARLIDWDVDGITTDFPDRLATFLRERGISF